MLFWFSVVQEEWDIYIVEHILKRKCSVYLSLGGKEEKTKNAVMATVGDRTREQEKLLLEDPFAEQVVLEWNPGGHFADSGKRLAKGIKWLMEKDTKLDMERLGIVPKRKSAKVIDFKAYVHRK